MRRFETEKTNRLTAGNMWKSGNELDLTRAPAIWAIHAENFNRFGKIDKVRMTSRNIIPVNAKTLIIDYIGVSEHLTITGIYDNVEIWNAQCNLPCIMYAHHTPQVTAFINCNTDGLYKFRHRGLVVFNNCYMRGQLNLYSTDMIEFTECHFEESWFLYCRDTLPEVRVGKSNTRSESSGRPRLPAGTLALCAADII